MSKTLTVSIADDMFLQIENYKKKNKITRSEATETLIRKGLGVCNEEIHD